MDMGDTSCKRQGVAKDNGPRSKTEDPIDRGSKRSGQTRPKPMEISVIKRKDAGSTLPAPEPVQRQCRCKAA